MRGCIEIARDCIKVDQDKRPTVGEISRELHKIDSMMTYDAGSSTPQVNRMVFPGTELLDVYPLELRFPFMEKEPAQCQLSLINKTDGEVGFFVLPSLRVRSLNGILMPNCTCIFTLKMLSNERLDSSDEVPLLMFIMKSSDNVRELMKTSVNIDGELNISTNDLYEQVQEIGGEMHFATLTAVLDSNSRWIQEATN